MPKKLQIFASLTKIDESCREVSGLATAEVVDKEGELFDYESSKPYFKAWTDEIAKATDGKSLGNVREMHQPSAVGKLTGIDFDDDLKQISVSARIVDDAAWQKCLQGVYTGFSIGGAYVKVWRDGEFTRYTANPAEISVVDNPCNPGSHFTAVKADGSIELRKFAEPSRTTQKHRNSKRSRPFDYLSTEATNTVSDKIGKVGARHSAETQQHHAAIADCLEKCAQALSVAQPHMDALLAKDDGMSAAAGAAIYKDSPTPSEIKAEQASMLETYERRQLEKVNASAHASTHASTEDTLFKIAELERSVKAAAKADEVNKGFEAIAETLNALAESIARLAGVAPAAIAPSVSAQKISRTGAPGSTVTKEQDSSFASRVISDDLAKMTPDERAIHEMKKALQNPQLLRQTPGFLRSAQ